MVSIPVLFLHCKLHTGLMKALMTHFVCNYCCLRKCVLTEAKFQPGNAVLHQLRHLRTRVSGCYTNQLSHILSARHSMGTHTQEHSACPKSECYSYRVWSSRMACLQAVCCKDDLVQPFFREGIERPVNIFEDDLHVLCSYFLDLHDLASAL